MMEARSNLSMLLKTNQNLIRRCSGYKLMQAMRLRSATHPLKAVLLLYRVRELKLIMQYFSTQRFNKEDIFNLFHR